MEQPTRHECIDHLRLAALGIRSHCENEKVVEMHRKADDGYLEKMARRVEVFEFLAEFYERKEREHAAKASDITAESSGNQQGVA